MRGTFFAAHTELSPQQLLEQGITAFEAGLHPKDSDKITPENYFLKAKQHFRNSIIDENIGSLAHCYLTLIQFYENHETPNPDIIKELLLVSQYINSVGSDGLKPMSQEYFKIPLLEMIEKIDDGAFLVRQLLEKSRAYKESLGPSQGESSYWVKLNTHFAEGKEEIATIKAARTLLEKDENEAGLQSVQHSVSFHPAPG